VSTAGVLGSLRPAEQVARFVRTPKRATLLGLLGLAAVTAPVAGTGRAWRTLAVATLAAVLADLALGRLRGWGWIVPDGAALSGMITGMVLSPSVSSWVAAGAAALAIGSKHVLRIRRGHVFNPAAFALVVAALAGWGGQSWWGATAGSHPLSLALLVATGLLVADRVNRFHMVGVFLGAWYGLLTFVALWVDPRPVVEAYRAPFVNAALFFAFFMLDDPPTSAGPRREQARYGAIVAAAASGCSLAPGRWRSCLLACWSATSGWRCGGPAAPLGSRASDIRHDGLS
jgi:Na+-translocating ferredoxin:NAD+ oxidoreductase RnfD subunit